jgi:hypothetical protein
MPFYVLGAPFSDKNKAPYLTNLKARFTVSGSSSPVDDQRRANEQKTDYVYKILDRQINKARGLLTYNALLFTALSLVSRGPASTPDPKICGVSAVFLGRVLALGACTVLLWLLKMSWGKADNYASADADFNGTLETVWMRTYWVTVSLYVSMLATALTIWVIYRL